MQLSKRIMAAWLVLACVAVPSRALAEDPPPPGGPFSQMVNVPALVENYARFIARKYSLDEQQEKQTVAILQKKTNDFLQQHEGTIFELYTTMQAVRGGGEMAQQELTDWGKRAMPIYQDAKNLIVGGNAEWRELLNDEQRAMHDEDVKLMYESFQSTDEQLNRIVTGEMTVDEFRNPPRPNRRRRNRRPDADANQVAQPPPGEPVTVAAPPGEDPVVQPMSDAEIERVRGTYTPKAGEMNTGETADASAHQIDPNDQTANREGVEEHAVGQQQTPAQTPDHRPRGQRINEPKASTNFASEWQKYVEEFIRKYQLNPGQEQTARKILRDCQDQAERYLGTRQGQIAKIDAQLATVAKDPKQGTDLRSQREKLIEPIGRIFERQLKPRLEKLPTRQQRQDAEAVPSPAAKAAGARIPAGGAAPARPATPRPGVKPN